MKKLSKVLAVVSALSLLSASFFGCKGAEEPSGSTGNGSGPGEVVTEKGVTDYRIALTFDSAPTVNADSTGKVKIFKADGTEIDTISVNEGAAVKDATYYTGASSTSGKISKIAVKDNLIHVDGNDLVIVPHTDSNGYSLLEPASTYFVLVDDGVISGTLKGNAVTSVTDKSVWTFTTKPAAKISGNTINVNKDGTGDFYTIQGAFDYLRKNEKTGDWTINVAAGNYHERLFYYGDANITLVGEIKDGTFGSDVKVDWKNVDDWGDGGARSRATFLVQGKCNMVIKNMTFINTYSRTDDGDDGSTQAETISYDATGNLIAYNSSFYSHQDTLYIGKTGNRSWFYKCYIEGDTDFIWGYADVALFEECSLRMVRDTAKDNQQDIIFAARSDIEQPANKGFVLLNSKVLIDEGVTGYYGRNSGADTQATVYNNVFDIKGTLGETLYSSKPSKQIYDVNGDLAIGYRDGFNYKDEAKTELIDESKRLEGCDALTARVANREYSGRYVILNRGYKYAENIYKSAPAWDISAYEKEFEATEDKSKNQIFVEPAAAWKIVGGATVELKAYDFEGKDISSSVTWSSTEKLDDSENYPDKITVSLENGTLVTKKSTSGTVTVKIEKDGFTDEAYIYVIPTYVPVAKVEFAADTVSSMNKGALADVNVTLSAEDTSKEVSDTNVVWTVSDSSVIKFFNKTDNKFVDTITTAIPEVQVYAFGSGKATLTATSADNTSGNSSEIEVSAKVSEWNPVAAGVQVNTDIQNNVVGTYNTMIIDASTNHTKNGKSAKMGLKPGNTRMQTRNVILSIPVTADCDIVVTVETAPATPADATTAAGLNYSGMYADGTKVVWDEATLSYTVKFDYETQAVDGDKLQVTSSTKGDNSGDFTAATKYAQLVFGSTDIYIMSIKQTTDGQEYSYTDPVALDVEIAFADKTDVILDLNGTSASTRTAAVTGPDSTGAIIKYASDNEKVATVNAETGAVTAVGIGYATISASTAADDQSTTFKSDSYIVYVKDTTAVADSYKLKLTDIKTPQNAGTYDFGVVSGTKAYWNDASHGWAVNNGGTLSFTVNGASTVKVGGCQYGKDAELSLSDGVTTVSGTYTKDCAGATELTWEGTEKAVLTLTVSGGNVYIPFVQVVSAAAELDPKFNTIYSYNLEKVGTGTYASDDGVLATAATGGNQTSGHGCHFAVGNTLTVKVAGASKISLLGCQYGADSDVKVTSSSGEELGTFTWKKGSACGDVSTFEYTGSADTLTLTIVTGGNTYLHGVVVVPGDLSYNLEKVGTGTYASDDGVLATAATGGNQTSGHGCHFAVGNTLTVKVAGASKISLLGCQYGADSDVKVTSSSGEELGTFTWKKGSACGDVSTFEYTGSADTLTLTIVTGGNTYLHGVTISY